MDVCHPEKNYGALVCISRTGGKGLLQLSGKQESIDRAVESQTLNAQRPLHLFKRGCKVFINSSHGNAMVFAAQARARQLSRLVGNHERPAR